MTNIHDKKTLFAFALLGAVTAGEENGRRDAVFFDSSKKADKGKLRGAWPAAAEVGIKPENFETEEQFNALRSVFTTGYLAGLNQGLVPSETVEAFCEARGVATPAQLCDPEAPISGISRF